MTLCALWGRLRRGAREGAKVRIQVPRSRSRREEALAGESAVALTRLRRLRRVSGTGDQGQCHARAVKVSWSVRRGTMSPKVFLCVTAITCGVCQAQMELQAHAPPVNTGLGPISGLFFDLRSVRDPVVVTA